MPTTAEDLHPQAERWDNPTVIVTLDAKRRLTVPAALAPAKPGDYFDARFDAEEDAIVFRRLAGRESWLAVLKACPVSPDDVLCRRRTPATPSRSPRGTTETSGARDSKSSIPSKSCGRATVSVRNRSRRPIAESAQKL